MSNRVSKEEYYISLARSAALRGTCLRRNYGAIIVKDDEIIATGYTGAPREAENCCDRGSCRRQELSIPSGQCYELCRSVHAEMNAVISASRRDMAGSVLYLAGYEMKDGKIASEISKAEPCLLCKRVLLNAGIEQVVSKDLSASTEDGLYYQPCRLWLMLEQV